MKRKVIQQTKQLVGGMRRSLNTLRRKHESRKYGFDIEDTWDLGYALAVWLEPRLKYFLERELDSQAEYGMSIPEYIEILEFIYDGMVLTIKENTEVLTPEEFERKLKGWAVLAKWHADLWN